MTELEGCIRFWERTLFDFEYLMEPGTKAQVESTIKHLKQLQKQEEVRNDKRRV